jgi:hypothetical protein
MIEDDPVKLQKERALIVEEIRSYPRPVAGCDAQFNHLLERQDAIDKRCPRLGLPYPTRNKELAASK